MTRTVAFRQSADIVRVVTPERRFQATHRPMALGRSPRRIFHTLRDAYRQKWASRVASDENSRSRPSFLLRDARCVPLTELDT